MPSETHTRNECRFSIGPVALLAILICALMSPAGAPAGESTVNRTVLRAVIPYDVPPTYFQDPKTREAAGFAVDVMDEIARRAGFSVVYSFGKDWPAIVDAVAGGRADIAPALGISEERIKLLAFTSAVETEPVSLFVRSDNVMISGLQAGLTIGVLQGSAAYETIKKNHPGDINLKRYERFTDGLFDLLAGQIDVFCCPAPTLSRLAKDAGVEDKIKTVGAPIMELKRGIAMRKDGRELLAKLNAVTEAFVGSPEYQRMYTKWFGKPRPFFALSKQNVLTSIILGFIIIAMATWRHLSLHNMNSRLLQSEAEIKEAQSIARIGRWELDLLTDRLHWSDTIFNIFEIEKTQFGATYEAFLEAIHPDDRTLVNKAYTDSLKNKQPYEVVHRLLMKDGRVKWVSEACRTDYDPQGRAVRSVGVVQDITERKQAEEALQESEKRHHQLFENMQEGFMIQDIVRDDAGAPVDVRYLEVNPAMERFLGKTRAEIIGKTRTQVLGIADPAVLEANRSVVETGQPFHMERYSSGAKRWYESFSYSFGPGRIATLVLDITERKKAEEKLRKSERQLRESQQVAQLGNWDLDLVSQRLEWSDQTYRLFDKAPEDFVPSFDEFARLVHPDDAAVMQTNFNKALESDASPYHVAVRIVNDSGREWVMEAFGVVRRGPSGNAHSIFGTAQDITERMRADEKVRQSEAKFRNLFESSTDGIFIIDLEGNFIDVNATAHTRLGYTKEEMLGLHISKLDDPAFSSRAADRMKEIHEHGVAVFESAHLRKDGTSMPVEVNARLMEYEGRTVFFSMIRDITERKRLETELRKHREELMRLVEERTAELKTTNTKLLAEIAQREHIEEELIKAQKLESLGVLAGGIAHDFNNLLTTVMVNVSLALIDMDEGHPAHKQLISADRALLRAQELTQQLLTFSKGGAPVKRATGISELLRESAGFALRGSRARSKFSIPDDLWQVEVDEGQISQVIHNLTINADQAMPNGGIIAVSCENATLVESDIPGLSPGRYVKIIVKDSGIGIPREHLQNIFDPYFTTKQRGSGLGLATAYSIMQKHGGHISVASEIGVGTTFTLYLPASAGGRAEQKHESTQPLPSGTGAILIMDDDESIRQTTADALIHYGYTTAFAENGSRAIELYRQAMDAGKSFDAVIMDLTIPGGMGGKEALQRLREIDPSVKAIVSSGYSNDPIMADYRSYGFAGVVTKPYRINNLIETVSRVIAERGSHQGSGA